MTDATAADDTPTDVGKVDSLVPIRLDIEADGVHLKDSFLWNLAEPDSAIDTFAQQLCADLELPLKPFHAEITTGIRSQVHVFEQCDSRGVGENRVGLNLLVCVGNTQMTDKVEWDLFSPESDPEHFARSLCADIGVGGSYPAAVAHCLRERLAWQCRAVALGDIVSHEAIDVTVVLRDFLVADAWSPMLRDVDEQELSLMIQTEERTSRRTRRLTKKAGPFEMGAPDTVAVYHHTPWRTSHPLLQQTAAALAAAEGQLQQQLASGASFRTDDPVYADEDDDDDDYRATSSSLSSASASLSSSSRGRRRRRRATGHY